MGLMSDEDMSMLESASGAEFDRLFLEMMVRHHSGAIDMAEEELRDGQHPGALEMAQEIKDTQEAEVAEMEALPAELGSCWPGGDGAMPAPSSEERRVGKEGGRPWRS